MLGWIPQATERAITLRCRLACNLQSCDHIVLCVMNPASTDIENIIVTVPCNHTVAY
jgi:hypothetical protein